MQHTPKELEAMVRWQNLRASNYKKSRQMIDEGKLGYAMQYQELQELCHQASMEFMLQTYPKY
jgi:hypothetical protein